jgi:Gram-negative bacterial TonB protein C-terminal
MNNTLLLTFATLLSAVFALPAHAAGKTTILKPTSKWVVNFADDYCRLGRMFGEGENAITVFMDRYSPSQKFRISLSGNGIKDLLLDRKVRLRFGEEKDQIVDTLAGKFEDKTPSLIIVPAINMAPSSKEEMDRYEMAKKSNDEAGFIFSQMDDARIQAVKHLSIYKSKKNEFRLETGSMGKPMATMAQCIDQQVASWGVDVKRHANLFQKVKPLKAPSAWLDDDDYPRDMLRKGMRGIINFRLSVDDKGVPTACHIQKTQREKGFDDTVCKAMMKKARFSPALDADKLPIASYYIATVNFRF